MMLNGGELDGVRVLSPATVQLMTSNSVDTLLGPGIGFGLGFEILLDPGRAGDYGNPGSFTWGGAYGTDYWVDPKDDLVALDLVQGLPHPWPLGSLYRDVVYGAVVGR